MRCSGGRISRPSSSSRFRIAGSSIMVFMTLFMRRTIASGVPFGKKKPFHTVASTPLQALLAGGRKVGNDRHAPGRHHRDALARSRLACAAPVWMVSHM